MRYPFSLTGLVIASLVAASASQAASVGRTPGSYSVSSTGSATYSVPIWVPPGPKGIQPSLAFTYNSNAGVGPLGIGWFISGLGSIARCNKTFAQDSVPAAVALATTDGYCLNGNRLRLTGGSYGVAGSTYQTEIADFSQITANGAAGNGPAYFTVQGRDGLTYLYGYADANGGANSQVIATPTPTASQWLLSKVIDRSGNNYVVNYTTLNGTIVGTAVPNTILWTPTSAGASTYAYSMQFNYTKNLPQSSLSKYLAGTHINNPELLSSVSVSFQSAVIKDYFLGYQASSTTGREELISIQECADSAQLNCLQASTVGYQGGITGVSSSATTSLSSPGGFYTHHDLNGDGISDILYYSGGVWYVSFGSATGYGAPINTGITALSPGFLVGNVNGGPHDGILANNGGTWWYYTWNGSSFAGTSTGYAYNTTAIQFQLADVNGDGLPDLVSLTKQSNGNGAYTVTLLSHLNTSNGSTLSFNSSVSSSYITGNVTDATLLLPDSYNTNTSRFDFDGDGRDDLVLQTLTGSGLNTFFNYYELISNGISFNSSLIESASISSATQVVFGNWNDDACTDVVAGGKLYLSDCAGGAAASFTVGWVLAAIDWDGDGRSDLIVQDLVTHNGTTLGVYLSTGSGVSSLVPTAIPYSASCTYLPIDVDGSGLDALGCIKNGSLTYYKHNGPKPDLAVSFTDGYGNSASPTYVSISQNNYSQYFNAQHPDIPTYPDTYYVGPLYVVNQVTFSDPSSQSNGTYQQTFWYYDAWTNLQGRGFGGFKRVGRHDLRNGLWDTVGYAGAFPASGFFAFDLLSHDQAGNQVVSFSFANIADSVLDTTPNNQRYFVYDNNKTTQEYEVGGSEDGKLITTTSTNYTFDNYGNATNVSSTVTDNDPGSPYVSDTWTSTTVNTIAPNTSTWCLGLPTQTTVTNASTAPGGAAITRTVAYNNPDYTNCRQTEKVVEPNSATYKVVEDYGYDSFGNLHTDTVTGVGMAPRVMTTNWTANGQFPQTVINALSQPTTLGFDPNNGMLTSQTDPNGLKTSWQYDTFGRMTQQSNPDNTSLTRAYSDCASVTYCPGAVKTLIVDRKNDSSGSKINDVWTYLDHVDRVVQTFTQTLGGAYSEVQMQYDSLGRLFQQSAPCFAGGSGCSATYWTTNYYDALNRLTKSQRPISATNGTLQTTQIQYAGRTTTITDPLGHNTTKTNLVTGGLARTQDHSGYNVNFKHDAFGSVLSVTDSLSNTLNTMTYDYGLSAFQRSSKDADLGPFSSTYDALGELTAYSDAKGQNFSVQYDALSRPTKRTEPDMTTTWNWGGLSARFDIGKLNYVTAAGPTGSYTESYGYDSKSRLSTKTITIPGDATYTYTNTYNPTTGLLDTLQYPVSTSGYQLKLQYAYQNGFLQQIADATTGTHYWTANASNSQGQYTQETLGNNVVVNHGFDAVTGSVGSIQAGVGGGAALQNNSYLFDEVGNLTQRQDNNAGVTENAFPDSLNRLDHTVGDTSTQMTYDAMGRIASWAAGTPNVNDYTTPQPGCTYYANSQLHAVRQKTQGTGVASYCYDANGNMTTSSWRGSSVQSITWTSFNQPDLITGGWPTIASGTSTSQFYYDQNHQRFKQRASYSGAIETTIYVGGLLEKMSNSSGTAYRHYIPAGSNTVVYTRLSSGTNSTYYISKDHLGSSAAITDQTGALLVKEKFAALGWNENTVAEEATMATISRHQFTGHEGLNNAGLWMVNMNGRIYVPAGSMFLSPDPRIADPENTQNYNRYSYANNNPLTLTDPTGFDSTGGNPCGGEDSSFSGCPEDANDPVNLAPNPSGDSGCTFSCLSSSAAPIEELTVQCTVCCGSKSLCWSVNLDQLFQNIYSPPSSLQIPYAQAQGPKQGTAQGHAYSARNPMCQRPLTASEIRDLISRFTVPNVYVQGQPLGAGIHMVAAWGIPGGFVTTTFSADGLRGFNQTTPFHPFTGTVVRSIDNTGTVADMVTNGYGGYPSLPPISPFESLEPMSSIDLGGLLDQINNATGPAVFNSVDKQAARYAQAHYPGC